MKEFFSATEPLEKHQILEIFRDVLALTKLFVAPFGLPHDSCDILGEFIAKRDFKSIHRCWEDFTARKVYSLKNVSDDSVAASLQYYLETKNDREVKCCLQYVYRVTLYSSIKLMCFVQMLEAMKVNERAASSLLVPQRVVQLPGGAGLDLEDLACTAFLSVATAWKVCCDMIESSHAGVFIFLLFHVLVSACRGRLHQGRGQECGHLCCKCAQHQHHSPVRHRVHRVLLVRADHPCAADKSGQPVLPLRRAGQREPQLRAVRRTAGHLPACSTGGGQAARGGALRCSGCFALILTGAGQCASSGGGGRHR